MPPPANGRRFRFVAFNDLHVRSPQAVANGAKPGYPRANEKASWAVAWARGETPGADAADFIVSAGDLIQGEFDPMELDFQYAQEAVLHLLGRPVLPCAGNHENRQGEGDAERGRAYERAHGPDRWNYLYAVGGIYFLVVDTSGGHRFPDEVTARRNAFVARSLDALRGKPTIVVTHVPLVVVRDEVVLVKSFGFTSWYVRDTEMLRLVDAHADHVLAVLGGHLHLTGVCVRNGIYHVAPSGTASFPGDLAAFDVYPDRIEVAMHSVPPEVLGTGRTGNIHGTERHGCEFSDRAHANGVEYVRGTASERAFTIPLRGRVEGDLTLRVWNDPARLNGPADHSIPLR
jgi:hypothetical protein